jgi:exopolysaccharide biosynthesis polyprenyl glycosylphosphotransferase
MKAETAIETTRGAGVIENRVPVWVMPAVKAGMVAFDSLLAAASFLIAFKLRESANILSSTAWAWSQEFVPYAGILYAAIIVRLIMFVYQRVYRFSGAFSYVHEAVKVLKAVAVGSLIIVAWAFLFRGGFAFREFSYSRSVFVFDFAVALALFLAFHLFVRFVQTRFRRKGINLIPTLIVGTNAEALQTITELRERRDLGYRVIGVVANNDALGDLFGGVPIVGGNEDLADVVRELLIQEVIITDDSISSEMLFDVMMQSTRGRRVEYRFAPKLFDLLPQKTSIEQIGVLPMVRLFREPLSDVERLIKRASDVVIAVVAILITSPFWLLSMLMVRLGSPGPIFFKQERVGMDGRVFLCYKFRTMQAGASDEGHREAYRNNIEGLSEGVEYHGKVKDDPRVTPGGKVLRRWSLDELPQFLNVLKGDMSVVGPRPPIPYEVEEYAVHQRKRLDMKPGITGLWQVSGRSRLSFEEMVRIDLYYIENWSLLFDFKIMLLTIPAIFHGDGAR